MAHIPGLYLKPVSFSPSYGRKKMTDTLNDDQGNIHSLLTISGIAGMLTVRGEGREARGERVEG